MRERTKIPPTTIYTGWWKFRPEAGPYQRWKIFIKPNGPYLRWKIFKAVWPISEFTFSSLSQCVALKLGPNLNLSSLVEKLYRLHAEWPISHFTFFTLSSLKRFHRKSDSKSQRLLSNRLLGGSMAGLTLKDSIENPTGWWELVQAGPYLSSASFTFSWLGV